MQIAFITILSSGKLRFRDVSGISKVTELKLMGEEMRIWAP